MGEDPRVLVGRPADEKPPNGRGGRTTCSSLVLVRFSALSRRAPWVQERGSEGEEKILAQRKKKVLRKYSGETMKHDYLLCIFRNQSVAAKKKKGNVKQGAYRSGKLRQ